MTPKLTNKGIDIMIKALAGETITFSKIALGNGDAPEDSMTLTDLVNPISAAEIGLDSIERKDSYVLLSGTLKNADLESGFLWTEVGIFCKDPDGGDDLLYAYCNNQMQVLDSEDSEPEGATYIPKFGYDVI